jgi:hypothetical protein
VDLDLEVEVDALADNLEEDDEAREDFDRNEDEDVRETEVLVRVDELREGTEV